MIRYATNSEIDQSFFLDTLSTIFSRYELVMLFYYSLSDIDPEVKSLIKKSGLIYPSIKDLLFEEVHFEMVLGNQGE